MGVAGDRAPTGLPTPVWLAAVPHGAVRRDHLFDQVFEEVILVAGLELGAATAWQRRSSDGAGSATPSWGRLLVRIWRSPVPSGCRTELFARPKISWVRGREVLFSALRLFVGQCRPGQLLVEINTAAIGD
jgi:hypothetical protein